MKFLQSLFSFLNFLAEYFNRKQLIDAGKAEQENETLHETLESNAKADAARAAVDHDLDGLLDDPNRRS